jgi:RNA polymerase sigma-70 factor (family 1)
MDIQSDSDDKSLVISIKNDSENAFKLLYERYNRKLYFYSLKYLGDIEEAEELVQSVFISIWEHRKLLDESMPIRNYVYRCAVNYIYNYLRKKAIRSRFIENELQKGELQSDQTFEQIYLDDLKRTISSIVETMPSQQQKIFNLSRFEGLTHEEIAKNLDLSVRTVENQIYRALKIIKSKHNGGIFSLFLSLW